MTHAPPQISRRPLARPERLSAALGGDSAALEALLGDLQPRVYGFALKLCGDAEDAEDVVQETLLAVATKLSDLRTAERFSSWVFTIARNHCLRVMRRRPTPESARPVESLDVLASAGDEDGPHRRAERSETWERLGSAMRQLTDEQREVVLLRDVEGLSAREVAEVLGVAVGAVKSRLHRARAQLREALSGEARAVRSGCPDIRLAFSRQLEGDLPLSVCAEMEAHVSGCRQCAAECDGLREVLAVCATTDRSCALPKASKTRFERAIRRVLRPV